MSHEHEFDNDNDTQRMKRTAAEAAASGKAQQCGCDLCKVSREKKPQPPCLQAENPTVANILRVALFCLANSRASSGSPSTSPRLLFFHLSEICDFIEAHREVLGIDRRRPCHRAGKEARRDWKKACQDTLSHRSRFFVSGSKHCGAPGTWKLRDFVSPWEDLFDFHHSLARECSDDGDDEDAYDEQDGENQGDGDELEYEAEVDLEAVVESKRLALRDSIQRVQLLLDEAMDLLRSKAENRTSGDGGK